MRALQAEAGYVHVYESFARAASRAGRLDDAATAFRRLLSFDIIVCCDTLVYVGQLEGMVAAARAALKPGGHPIFTLEQLADDSGDCGGYRLMPSGRFSHYDRRISSQVA